MKHIKTSRPNDSDLRGNPLIGGSKGATMAGISAGELEELTGETTIEGDVENDTNPHGGIDKPIKRAGRPNQDK